MDEGLLDGIEGEDSSANAITISSEDPDVTPVDGGEEETAGSSYFIPPLHLDVRGSLLTLRLETET